MPIPGDVPSGSGTLRLLALLLHYPEEDALPLLRERVKEARWLEEPVAELGATPLPVWQGEYTRLFLNDHPHVPCPPFESAYLGQGMYGPAQEALATLYREGGVTAREMPEDFLATELTFAALLLEREDPEASALYRRLWSEHLDRWLPRFARDLARESRLQIYRALAVKLASLAPTHPR